MASRAHVLHNLRMPTYCSTVYACVALLILVTPVELHGMVQASRISSV